MDSVRRRRRPDEVNEAQDRLRSDLSSILSSTSVVPSLRASSRSARKRGGSESV